MPERGKKTFFAIFIEMAKHIVIRNLMCNLKNEISKYILQLAMQFSIHLELFRLGILGRTLLYLWLAALDQTKEGDE